MIKLSKYTHLTLEEREKMYAWLEAGMSLRKIAYKLGRNHETLSRELKRNTKYSNEYMPCHAQRRYKRVSQRQRYQAPLKNPEIFLYVRAKLRLGWSPEIISGRISMDVKGASINKETVHSHWKCTAHQLS